MANKISMKKKIGASKRKVAANRRSQRSKPTRKSAKVSATARKILRNPKKSGHGRTKMQAVQKNAGLSVAPKTEFGIMETKEPKESTRSQASEMRERPYGEWGSSPWIVNREGVSVDSEDAVPEDLRSIQIVDKIEDRQKRKISDVIQETRQPVSKPISMEMEKRIERTMSEADRATRTAAGRGEEDSGKFKEQPKPEGET